MPETDTLPLSDELRSRASEPEGPPPDSPVEGSPSSRPGSPPPPPPPPQTPLGSVADAALGDVKRTQGALADAATKRAESARAAITEHATQQEQFGQQAGASVPKPPVLPPPPKRELRAFLAPVEGAPPEKALGNFIAAVGLFATGATALSKGNARTSLAALTGALKGWQEGDTERADREFKNWQASTETLIKNAHLQRESWEDWFKTAKLSMEQRTKGLELKLLADGYDLDPKRLEAEGAKYMFEIVDRERDRTAQLEREKARIEAHREDARKADEYKQLKLEQEDRHHKEKLAQKERELTSAVNSATPAVLDMWAEKRMRGEALPSNLTRGKSGQQFLIAVDARVIELANQRGIDPSNLSGIKSDLDGKRNALKTLQKTTVLSEAQAARFDTHLDALVQLSKRVDDSGRPAWNRMVRKAKGEYQGDVGVRQLETQAFEVAMELSRLTVGTAQGDQATREHARQLVNSWMTQPQLEAVAEQLKQNAHNNVKNNIAQERELVHYIDSIGGLIDKPKPKPPDVVLPDDKKKSDAGWSIKRLD